MSDERITTREVAATLVPYGEPVLIPAGTHLTITHRLGGNFTVLYERGMARITAQYADALGEENSLAAAPPAAGSASSAPAGPPGEEALWTALRTVYDPEIPVNIVDLGLVYRLEVKTDPAADGQPERHRVEVDMTLTAPGCGMGPAIAQDAQYRLERVPGVSAAAVGIVWDPPWNQDMISLEGKMQLGLV